MADLDKPKESLLGRMKDKAKEMHGSVKDKLADLSEAGMDKLKEMLAEINDMLPLIRELGYTIEGVQVGIGLIPNISIDIGGLAKTMDEETFKRTLEEHKDKKLLVSVIRTLQTTSILHQKIKLGQMQSDSATILLSLPPRIVLKFK